MTPTNQKMKEAMVVVDGKALIVYHGEYRSSVYTQAINPKTGKPWQATRESEYFSGEGREAKAMACWLRRSRNKQGRRTEVQR